MARQTSRIPRLVKADPWLTPNTQDVINRIDYFEARLNSIEADFGSLVKFASGYEYFGFHIDKKNNRFVYREWAPGARQLYLTGDFNHWHETSHPMCRIEYGVWEIFLDYETYKDRLKHGSFIKVVVMSDLGLQKRIPAYIRRVVQDEQTKDFTGQIWFPKRFDWSGDNFKTDMTRDLFIYEAHVGMAQEKEGIGTYSEFTQNVLPRIKKAGYNAVQLMAVQEHPYYGSFGYHVANFFAPSSRFGTPEELKTLIKTAHSMGIAVIMDIVHSHTVKNINEGLNLFDGTETQYFHPGPRGEHPDWDSKLFDYGKTEVLRFLLSNVKFWLQEFHFDGFRFDGVGSMLYFHHGNETIDSPDKYFNQGVEWDAVRYLQLANYLIKKVKPTAVSIAEDVTGMPGLTAPIADGGIGFTYRLGMGIPDFWIKYLKDTQDEDWNIYEMWNTLNDRLPFVRTVAYCESHDQALVGDKTLAFRLMDKEMYFNMRVTDNNLIIDRGMALHKMIRLFSISLGGQAWLNFMGNEFGHPEWIDFPRLGNDWSYKYARRQWSLVDDESLKYHFLADFDREMIGIIRGHKIMSAGYARQLNMDEANKCIIYERGGLLFLFNFHTTNSIPDYEFTVPEPGTYAILLNSDSRKHGGHGRIDDATIHHAVFDPLFSCYKLKVYLPNRTALILERLS
ncbi:MAG TPA: alpha amylase C-terminal domain-containing protein [Bacteroidales bacterium]|jgi:1,4-alpha-glucan branching enzyme|nr:alpha amylase C-terminal domain-containing protein [Bacteroidales bacterium]